MAKRHHGRAGRFEKALEFGGIGNRLPGSFDSLSGRQAASACARSGVSSRNSRGLVSCRA